MEDFNSKYSGEEVDGLLDEIGNKVDKVDGKQLSTEDFTTTLKQKLDGLSNYDDTTISQEVEKLRTDLDALVSGDTTTAIKTFNEVIAFLDGISDTEDLSSIIASIEQQIAGKMDSVTLAKVATSGSYDDLSNKPTIPSAVTEATVSGWGFTKNTGTYSKPSTGIPKTDLASGVQTSLNKADTALQSYTEQYKGTVTGVKINGSTKNPSNGVVDLGTVITSHQDISGKQDKLVSGTNIKTINGESILGSGNISISGEGGGSSGGGSKEFVEVEPMKEPLGYHGDLKTIAPNNVYVFTKPIVSLSALVITKSDSKGDEYSIMFTASKDNVSISLPRSPYKIYWANGVAPTINSGDLCELSLVRIGNDIKAVLATFKAVE